MISIAIPVYKSMFLDVAIQSVLNQTFNDFELIILNDKSPDNIKQIIKKYNDSRIKYYENDTNVGQKNLINVWNQCLSYARGDRFVLFSDDDIYDQSFLEEMNKLSIKYPDVDLFHCRVQKINTNGDVLTLSPLCPEYESALDFIWHRLNGYRLQFAPDFMCRTKKLKEIGGFYDLPLAWGSDDITWFKLAMNNGVAYLPEPLCSWRISDINLSKIGNVHLRLAAIDSYEKWMNLFILDYIPGNGIEKDLIKDMKKNTHHNFQKKREYLLSLHLSQLSGLRLPMELLKYTFNSAFSIKIIFKQIFKRMNHSILKLNNNKPLS